MTVQTLYTGHRICYHHTMRGFQLPTIALTFIAALSAQLSPNLECTCRPAGGDRYTCDCAAAKQVTLDSAPLGQLSVQRKP